MKYGATYKAETYKGYKVEFKYVNGFVWAKAPKLTRQYIGTGKTKSAAFSEAKRAIDRANR